MKADDLPFHPIIRAALAQHGMTPEDVLALDYWRKGRSPLITSALRLDVPFILLGTESGALDWGHNKVSFKFERTANGYRFTVRLPRMALPESVITQMCGRSLGDIVDLPGAERVTITEQTQEDDEIILVIVQR